MSLLQAYLRNPKTQRALSKKPGQEGFSLIELVIVVAVLAVLAVIAVPAFDNIASEGRTAAAKSAIANALKECRVSEARTGTGAKTALTSGNGLTFDTGFQSAVCTDTEAVVCVANSPVEAYGVNLTNNSKYDSNDTLGAAVGGCAANSAFTDW